MSSGQWLVFWIIMIGFTLIWSWWYIQRHDTKPQLGPRDWDRLMEEIRRQEED